jgi:hypothetical protein
MHEHMMLLLQAPALKATTLDPQSTSHYTTVNLPSQPAALPLLCCPSPLPSPALHCRLLQRWLGLARKEKSDKPAYVAFKYFVLPKDKEVGALQHPTMPASISD